MEKLSIKINNHIFELEQFLGEYRIRRDNNSNIAVYFYELEDNETKSHWRSREDILISELQNFRKEYMEALHKFKKYLNIA